MTKRQIIFLTLWGCCLSAMIAGVAFIFLMLEQAGSHLSGKLFPILIQTNHLLLSQYNCVA